LDKIEISVLSEGKNGIFGLGAEDARIRVRVLSPSPQDKNQETIDAARDVLGNILSRMDIEADIEVVPSPTAANSGEENETVTLNIEGNDLGNLIGRKGATIEALQYLVRVLTARRTKSKTPIMIDVQSYKQRRYDDLRTLALNVALQVKSRKSSCRLEPMSPFERRIVHMTLADDPDVTTESIGEGETRKVVILPRKR
jgi:spoIIIJ-associated protein